jgi:selenocysteine-specific elongation factor
MGHIDSGKTSLCKVLTSIASTASLDKNPQSKERGITIDLGFSALYTHIPQHLMGNIPPNKKYIQYTLVDCPGHASLMKTIIASSKIIDMLILVIDVTKGI